jgi:hypothetical protein
MSKQEDDLKYLQGALGSLENYLLSSEIYYPLGGAYSRDMVSSRLSLGALLFTLKRIQAYIVQGSLPAEFTRVEEARQHWRVHWEQKAGREFVSRLNLWQNALSDLQSASSQESGVYRVEIRNRVIVELLRQEAGSLPESEITRMNGLDHVLRSRFVPGEFIWEPELEKVFPPGEFWYLYGQVRL